MDKKILCWLLTFTMVFSMFGGIGQVAFGESFTDVDSHWAKTDIEEWTEKDLISGYGDGTFKPNDNITRAEFITLINNVINIQMEEEISFSDVKESDWYYKDLKKAIYGEYITGYGDNTFRANERITRQEVAVILQSLVQLEAIDEDSLGKLTDTEDTPDWSKDSLMLAVEKGYLTGYEDNTLKASNYITRAESVKVLNNLFGIIYNEAGTYGPSVDEDVVQVTGNVTVSVEDVTLQNMIIDGDLYLAEGIGEGDVTLDNITVTGETIVKGGGENSIIIKNSSLANLLIIKKDGKIRIIAQGNTTINKTYLYSSARLQVERLNANSFGDVEVIRVTPGESVEFEGSFDKIDVKALVDMEITGKSKIEELNIHKDLENVNISVSADSRVEKLYVDSEIEVVNKGIILEALGDFAKVSDYDVKLPVNLQPRRDSRTSSSTEPSKPTEPTEPKYSLTLNVAPTGAGTTSGAGSYEEGTKITITATANGGYEFVEWKDGENQITTSSAISYTTTSENKTFTAYFESTGEAITPEAYFLFDSETGTITKYFAKGQSGDLPEILHPVIPDLLGDDVPVKIIGESAFDFGAVDDPNEFIPIKLTGVTLPSSLEHIADFAFRNNTISRLILPDEVASIGREAFRGNSITRLVVPNSLVTLGRSAFRENSIHTLTLSNSLESIGQDAFRSNQLTLLSVPSNVKTIEEAAFRDNLLTAVELTQGLEVIGQDAFERNLLESIIIPDGVTTIEEGAFHTNKLNSITMPDSVTVFGDRIFYRNEFTEIPQLPSGITSIPIAMFGENLITQISIPDNITHIGDYAFIQNQITSISSANLNNVTFIGDLAFDNNQISSLEFNPALEEIGWQAFSHNLLSDLAIPATLKMVNNTAFWDNELISISIGDEVEIKDYALHRNMLNTITIGTNVTLGDNLLAGLFGDPVNNRFREAYLANGAGTYTGTQTGNWTKIETPPEPSNSFTVIEGGTHKGAVAIGTANYSLKSGPALGSLTFNADGSFNYTAHRQPTTGFVANDSFVYCSSEGQEYIMPISITPTNDAPVASDYSFTVARGATHPGKLSATDVDRDALGFVRVTEPSYGTLTFNPDGSFTYIQNIDNLAENDSFTFIVNDGLADSNNATVTISIK